MGSDWINIPKSLLFKIIIGYSGSPTGRKMKLGAGGDEHSSRLTDGQTDERNGRLVQNTLSFDLQAEARQCCTLGMTKGTDSNGSTTCPPTPWPQEGPLIPGLCTRTVLRECDPLWLGSLQ